MCMNYWQILFGLSHPPGKKLTALQTSQRGFICIQRSKKFVLGLEFGCLFWFFPFYTQKLAWVKNVWKHVGKQRVTEATTLKLSGPQEMWRGGLVDMSGQQVPRFLRANGYRSVTSIRSPNPTEPHFQCKSYSACQTQRSSMTQTKLTWFRWKLLNKESASTPAAFATSIMTCVQTKVKLQHREMA